MVILEAVFWTVFVNIVFIIILLLLYAIKDNEQ
jgi:hypothetical protein